MKTTLRDALRSRNLNKLKETEAIITHVTPLLWHTIATFPSGTSHTPLHTETVEKIASLIVTPELLSQLNDDEIQLLILACHFHDLGMAGTECENLDQTTKDQARRDHAVRVAERIKEKWRELFGNSKVFSGRNELAFIRVHLRGITGRCRCAPFGIDFCAHCFPCRKP